LESQTDWAGNRMDGAPLDLSPYFEDLESYDLLHWVGHVCEMVGLLIESEGPAAALGDFVEIETSAGNRIRCQVVGFRDGRVLSLPLDEPVGLQLGNRVITRKHDAQIGVSSDLLGRVIDGFGKPIDGAEPIRAEAFPPIRSSGRTACARSTPASASSIRSFPSASDNAWDSSAEAALEKARSSARCAATTPRM
jgi:flagellar biosynthesis/type III secretory pathway ATPase